uniref:Uncharacterized protein n=1 Tax=Moniliophthora roreri TaxID=221103 RepID=A0A0W0FE63_MONRR
MSIPPYPLELRPEDLTINPNGKVACSACGNQIGLGPGGHVNFIKQHYLKEECRQNAAKHAYEPR